MADLESKILVRELGQLGGVGARLAARFLRSVPHELTLELPASPAHVESIVMPVLSSLGHSVPELPGLAVVCGSGRMNLNPTIVVLTIVPSGHGSQIKIRAVAKEGAIQQDSAKKAAERIEALLKNREV